MNPSRSSIAIESVVIAALLSAAMSAWAEPSAGVVTQMSGPLLVRKADGVSKILAVASKVHAGDTLETQTSTFVEIRFSDQSQLTLGPGTRLTIDALSLDTTQREARGAEFTLVKGGLRASMDPLVARQPERYWLNTPSGKIDMSNATFIAELRPPSVAQMASLLTYLRASTAELPAGLTDDTHTGPAFPTFPLVAQNAPGLGGGLAPGLYVHVIDGLIQLSNRGGVQQFAAGQFGFTGSVVQPPVIVPNNPGIQFNPPPAFQSSAAPSNNANKNTPKTVDCEVR